MCARTWMSVCVESRCCTSADYPQSNFPDSFEKPKRLPLTLSPSYMSFFFAPSPFAPVTLRTTTTATVWLLRAMAPRAGQNMRKLCVLFPGRRLFPFRVLLGRRIHSANSSVPLETRVFSREVRKIFSIISYTPEVPSLKKIRCKFNSRGFGIKIFLRTI